jgi:flagellar motor component MotA
MKKSIDVKILFTVAIIVIGLIIENYTISLLNVPDDILFVVGVLLSAVVIVLAIRVLMWVWKVQKVKETKTA